MQLHFHPMLRRAALCLLGLLPLAAAWAEDTEWRWLSLADYHAAEIYAHIWEEDFPGKDGGKGWRAKGYASREAFQAALLERDIGRFSRLYREYGGELLVIPGDTNGGHWYAKAYRDGLRSVYPGLSDAEVVRQAAHLCYGGLRNALAAAGYTRMLVAVGDHEIGDNPWPKGSAVARLVPVFRAGFADVFNEEPVVDPADPGNPRRWRYEPNAATANRLFSEPIGSAPSRPLGTPHEETSYAWQYRNVLFITVDIFHQEDPEKVLGEEGTVTGALAGAHLAWFKAVLAEAAHIPSIRHIVVQAHLPILYPVRKYDSSGMLVARNEESPFLEAMRAGGVDLYIAGEVHSNTVTLDPGSSLVQWVSRGNGTTNFSTVDVTDDKLVVNTWKNGGGAAEDVLLGTLVIDKSGSGPRRIETSGLLKAIDPRGLNIHYTFDEPVAAGSILTGIADPKVSGTACSRAYANTGEFSAEYTAWAKGTKRDTGVLGGAVRMAPGKSVLGLSSMGPISGDHPRTVALWLRTTSPARQILLNTTSFWGKERDFFNLSLNDGRFEIALGKGRVKAATAMKLNDGAWHHVAAVVPFKCATLDDVQLYVDGVPQQDFDTTGGNSPIKTGQANWMGIGVLLSRSSFKLDAEMGMAAFDGALDDFALWTRALTPAEIAALQAGARDGRNAADMEREFASRRHPPAGTGDAAKRPNIVILLADDLGYGELGCYGQQVIQTPNIDALAAKGLRFTDFYAGTAVCSPSRAVLMTGVHAGHATIRGNSGFHPEDGSWGRVALGKDELTLAEMLRGAGYQTAFVGKWHLDVPEDVSTWAAGRGFDFAVQEQWGKKAEGGEFDERDHWVNGRERAIFYNYKEHDCLDEFRTDIILEFLDKQRQKEKPLFLFMSYRAPHAHEFFLRETENYKEHGWPEIERRHASRITMLDRQIKRLLDKLEETGELENTFILFTSDNGPHQEDGHNHDFFRSSGGLRGFKRDMYEGGVRVPAIVYWPGRSVRGVTAHQATFYDVMPTLAELAGIEIPERTDGISFLPEVLGREQRKHDHIYWELQLVAHPDETGFLQAVRMGDWKAVRYGSGGRTELYNLNNDLPERNDVPAQYPGIVERMEAIFRTESAENIHYPFAGQGFLPQSGH